MKTEEKISAETFKNQWKQSEGYNNFDPDQKERVWQKLSAKVSVKRFFFKYAAAASAIGLIVLGGYLLTNIGSDTQKATTSVVSKKTRAGDMNLLILPDGTKVWLNSNSTLDYPQAFSPNQRAVTLHGEAFFDVAKDAARPFVIKSGDITTKVLGTSFSIKAWPSRTPVVSVVSGKVEVESKKGSKILLTPGQSVEVNIDANQLIPTKVNVENVEWKNRVIDADNKTLTTVAKELEKIKGISIIIQNEEVANRELEGAIDTQNSTEEIIKTITFALGIKYEANGKKIILKK